MTAAFLKTQFPGWVALIDAMDHDGYNATAIMSEINRRLAARLKASHAAA